MSENNYGLPDQLTKQAIYDKCKAHMLAQGARSEVEREESTNCVFRDPYGRACPVGCLMPDELQVEGVSTDIKTLLHWWMYPSQRKKRGENPELEALREDWAWAVGRHEPLLSALQYVHDVYEPEDWEEQLRVVAEHRGLTP